MLLCYKSVNVDHFVECSHDAFLNCEGSGLYITQSAANHSCVPNAQISFPYNNSVLRFTAINDIPAQQVSCSTSQYIKVHKSTSQYITVH